MTLHNNYDTFQMNLNSFFSPVCHKGRDIEWYTGLIVFFGVALFMISVGILVVCIKRKAIRGMDSRVHIERRTPSRSEETQPHDNNMS